MRTIVVVVAMVCLLPAVASAQPPPAAPAQPGPPEQPDMGQALKQMGGDNEGEAIIKLIAQATGMDPAQAMLLMMLAGEGGGGKDLVGMILFSQMLRAAGGTQTAAIMVADTLLVIEDGTVYRINVGEMKVEGSVRYRPPKGGGEAPAEMGQVLKQAKEKAEQTMCLSNMKQLCVAALMYVQDHNGTLPAEGWPDALEAYTRNRQIYICPLAPGKPVGYALNEKVAGVKADGVRSPADTVLFFESDEGGEIPFGGLDALVAKPRHLGGVILGFVDGHAKVVPLEEARKLLQREINE